MAPFRFAGLCLIFLFLYSCKNTVSPDLAERPESRAIVNATVELLVKGNGYEALNYLQQAYHKIEPLRPRENCKKLLWLGRIYTALGQPQRALGLIDSASYFCNQLATVPEERLTYARISLFRGDILIKQKRYNEAFQEYYFARSAVQGTPKTFDYHYLMFQIATRVAEANYWQHRYLKAIPLSKEAIAEVTMCKADFESFSMVQGVTDNIGLCFARSKMPDSAIKYYNKALSFIAENKHKFASRDTFIQSATGIILGNRAKALDIKKNYRAAKADYIKSIQINSRKGFDQPDANYATIGLGALYLKTNQPDSTRILLEKVERFMAAQAQPDSVAHMRYLKLKADYLKVQGDFKTAYNYLSKYLAARAEAEENTIDLVRSDFSHDFSFLDQKYKLISLNKENQLKNAYLSGAVIFSFMCLVIILMFIHSRKRSKMIITNMNKYNSQLKLAVSSMEKRNKEFSQLMNILGHDLKTPITAINKIAEVLLITNHKTEEDVELIKIIKGSSMNMEMTVSDLMQVGNPSNELNGCEVFDIEELVFDSVALMKYQAVEKNQHILLSTSGKIIVKMNREKIWRVLNNLVSNAIKFSDRGASIEINMYHRGQYVQVCVKDRGIGIPANVKETVFDIFTEARRKGTAGERSYGMGLHISKQIIESYGGKIWFESEESEGSIFYLLLPVLNVQ